MPWKRMWLNHDFEGGDVSRAERAGCVNFIVMLRWSTRMPAGLGALATIAIDAAAWLRDEWGVRSARVAPEALCVRVARRDADEAAGGLVIFSRMLPLSVTFVS